MHQVSFAPIQTRGALEALISAGRAVPFWGTMDVDNDQHYSGKFMANGVDGTITGSYLDPAYDDSAWPTYELPMWSANYGYTSPTNGHSVPVGGAGGDGHWVFRAHDVVFPSNSATSFAASGSGWTVSATAEAGERLYGVELWSDNSGSWYLPDVDASPALVQTNYVGADYTGSWVLSAPPGAHLIVCDKNGDTTTDGVGIRLFRLVNPAEIFLDVRVVVS
jgi:hypothetical protein